MVNQYNRSVCLVLVFFILGILIRLPLLNRPLYKHHDFNSAVILMGLESWKQGGGAEKFHFIPLLNYQNPNDKLLKRDVYIDEKGNQTYLSFGPGWYIIPYVIFNTFKIPFTPLALRVLNLFFLFAAVLLLHRFLYYLFSKAGYDAFMPSLGGCFIFLFNPSILWFLGNGYVCTGIVLPFLIAILHYGIKMLQEPDDIKARLLLPYSIAGICSIYIDWYGVSFLALFGITALLKIRKHTNYWKLSWVTFIIIISGVLLILIQFVSYSGWHKVYHYWTSRYADRGLIDPHMDKSLYILKTLMHLVSGFLPVFIAFTAGFIIKKPGYRNSIAQPLRLAMRICLLSCVLHCVIFLSWAGKHDFSVIPYSIILSLTGGLITHLVPRKYVAGLALFTLTATLVQFYYINISSRYTAKKLAYDAYQKTGAQIGQIAKNDERIFCNDNYAVYQFYAKRNFTQVNSYEQALEWAGLFGVHNGVWIKIQENSDTIIIDEIKHFNQDYNHIGQPQ